MVRNFARVLLYDETLKAKPALHHVMQLVFELFGKFLPGSDLCEDTYSSSDLLPI